MPLINLIYEQQIQKRAKQARVRAAVLATAGLAAIVVVVSGFFVFEAARYTIQAHQMEALRDRLKPKIEMVEKNKADLETMKPRLTTLETALTDTARWDRILTHVTKNTPTGIWLTNVKSSVPDQKKGVQVLFTGNSTNQELVGLFILRLGASTDLEAINLKYTQERVIEGGKAIEFEIVAYVAGTAPKQVVKEKA